MEGVTLFGKRKDNSDKIVYVKKYQSYLGIDFHELDDLMVFDILRSCGIAAPKVKIKTTMHASYLFSTDIRQQQLDCSDPHPEFIPVEKLIVRDTPYTREPISNTLRSTSKDSQELIHVNTINLAKFMLACLLLRLNDLRASNTGILITRSAAKTTASIAIIDFLIQYDHMSIHNVNAHDSLISLVNSQPGLRVFLKLSNLAVLDEKDYQQAFRELEDCFIPACDKAEASIKRFAPERTENIERAEKLLQHWKTNFETLRKFASECANDNTNINYNRASMKR